MCILLIINREPCMFNVLIIEEGVKQSAPYRVFLEGQGYATFCILASAGNIVDILEEHHIDVILCDYEEPDIDVITPVQLIRASDENVPIIVLSSSNAYRAKQRAFTAGADDFMAKPIDLNELLLRISALLRRVHTVSKQRIVIGNAVLDHSTLTVTDGSECVFLPPKEFKVLFKLCSSPGRIFTRQEIMDDVWGIHVKSNERTVDVHIKRLRARFEDSESFRIETVRGIGYKATALKV